MANGLTMKIVFPLAIILVVYLCVGAVIFSAIEEEEEMKRREHIEQYINTFLGESVFLVNFSLRVLHHSVTQLVGRLS